MNGTDVFKMVWLKRRAQFSTVAFLKTADPKRLPQFIQFIYNIYSSAGKPFNIYIYKVWSGLFKVDVKKSEGGNVIEYVPVSGVQSQSQFPFLQVASQSASIKDLQSALFFLDNAMNTSSRVIAIFYGLFNFKSAVSDQEIYPFVKFVRSAIFTPEYYSKYHFVVIFTDDLSIVDEDTLKHSIVANVPYSTKEERIHILRDIANQLSMKLSSKKLEIIAEATRGLSLHELESVALESFFRHQDFRVDVMTQYKYDIIRKSGILDIEEPTYGFDAVGGYKVVKEFIKDNIVKIIENPKKAEKLGIRPPRGILFFGPPGTGKTHFARALAKELNIPFLRLRTENIVSKWYGETSRNIAKAINTAEEIAPCILFIDEIDRFGRRGHLTEHEESRRAFSILLEWLGDARRKTIVVGTTNRPEDLDEAFVRVGRFDYIVPMLYPDYEARLEILRIHTNVIRKVPLDNVDLAQIASRTELWTGAELEELVLRAARNALKEDASKVSMEHFERAIDSFRVNIDERRRQMQHYLQLAEQFTNDAEFLDQLKESFKSRIDA